jgi:outer membrane lipoprotein SlyB
MMKAFLFIGVALAAGCAAHPDPIVDMKGVNVAQYEEDLAQCKSYGDEVKVEQGILKGAATGAVVGGVVGAIDGNTGRGAGYGSVAGGTKSGVRNQREKEQVVKRCMRGRGYQVLN